MSWKRVRNMYECMYVSMSVRHPYLLYGVCHMLRHVHVHAVCHAIYDMLVFSPGGTTIAGIHALENGSFRGTVMNAVVAASNRATELAEAAKKQSSNSKL